MKSYFLFFILLKYSYLSLYYFNFKALNFEKILFKKPKIDTEIIKTTQLRVNKILISNLNANRKFSFMGLDNCVILIKLNKL